MKLKVIKADAPLEGLILNLKEISDMVYLCSNTGYTFVDGMDELYEISRSKEKEFWDMHVFTVDIGEKIVHVLEVERLD